MTLPSRPARSPGERRHGPPGDVVEADFEIVRNRMPANVNSGVALATTVLPGRKLEPARLGFWLFGTLAAACAFWFSGGHALIATAPSHSDGISTAVMDANAR